MLRIETANSTYLYASDNGRLVCLSGTYAGLDETDVGPVTLSVGEPFVAVEDDNGPFAIRTTPVTRIVWVEN